MDLLFINIIQTNKKKSIHLSDFNRKYRKSTNSVASHNMWWRFWSSESLAYEGNSNIDRSLLKLAWLFSLYIERTEMRELQVSSHE